MAARARGGAALHLLLRRLDLAARRPYSGTINTPGRRLGVPVFVTRPKPEANAAPVEVGDRVAVGLTSFRVLPDFTFASERGGKILDAGKK